MDLKDDGVVEAMKQLKLTHLFNEKDVPQIFKTLINNRMNGIKNIFLKCYDSHCLLEFDDFHIRFEKNDDNWTVTYVRTKETMEVADPEKSIIDHLWLVLKNPSIKPYFCKFSVCENPENRHSQKMNPEKLNTLLQSMIDSIDHQIHMESFYSSGFNEDTFLSMLKHVKSGTLEHISFNLSWKEEGKHEKMKEIVELDQWKQAKHIFSVGVTPLKIENLFHCLFMKLKCDSITPEIVTSVCEHFFYSSGFKSCELISENEEMNMDAILNALQSIGFHVRDTRARLPVFKYLYDIDKHPMQMVMFGGEKNITIRK
ncbi:unnamed protein product [Caenorhabditis brenneri]